MPRFVLNTRIQNACFITLKCLGNCTKDRDQVKELERIRSLRLEDMGDIHKCDDPKAYTVSLDTIKWLSMILLATRDAPSVQAENAQYRIHSLLKGSTIYTSRPKPKPRDPELEERLEHIQKQMEEIKYQSMVSDVAGRCHMSHRATNLNPVVPGVTRIGKEYSGTIPGAGDARSFAEDLREANKQATVIINILFSVLGVGFAVFYASYTVTSDVGMRILLGLFAAIAIAAIEAYLYRAVQRRGKPRARQRNISATSRLQPESAPDAKP